MRQVFRLSINALAGRRRRTALLVAAVALATALVAAISCALASMNAGMEMQIATTVGRADLRVRQIADQRFDESVLELIRAQPDVVAASPRVKGSVTLENPVERKRAVVAGIGVDPAVEYAMVAPVLAEGREVRADDEIVLDPGPAEELRVGVGDRVRVVKLGEPAEFTVVGITKQQSIEFVRRPGAAFTRPALAALTGYRGRVHEITVQVPDGADVEALATAWTALMPQGIVVQPTERFTSGIGNTIRANNFGFVLASTLAYISAAFIVLTGLTTNLLERQRELAVMRCIGAGRATLAGAQLMVGLLVGTIGAALGLPLGVALAWLMTEFFPHRLPAGLHATVFGLAVAAGGSVLAGLVGAAWPAVTASRAAPLSAMRPRSAAPSRLGLVVVSVLGVLGVAAQLLIVGLAGDGQTMFWGYALAGLPLMFVGYFLLGVPVVLLVAWALGPVLSVVLGLPRRVLLGSVRRTPFRNGFTAGALMVGLAMMTSIWTNGSALLRDWLDSIEFPDAFVHGWLGLDAKAQEAIEKLPFVSGTCAITIMKTDGAPFGVTALRPLKTTFVAFEPEPFFRMTRLHWVQGEPVEAQRRLEEGGAVLVAREFIVSRPEMGVGQSITISQAGKKHSFEIVGVVSSPGLDIVSKSFNIGREQADMSIHSIFGSRADLRRVFNTEAVHLIQVGVKPEVQMTDAQIRDRIKLSLGNRPTVVGSGRDIKEGIMVIGRSSMRLASMVAIGAMVIGCLGVVNVVVAGIDARRHEFGVLRAIGAGRGMVARLVLAEVLVIALAACLLGTGMGLQGSWAGVRLYELLVGLELRLAPPLLPIALGCTILVGLTLLFVAPTVVRLARQRPRDLLGATRG